MKLELITDILKQISLTLADGNHLSELKQEAEADNAAFNVKYELGKAIDKNNDKKESLWAALGAACDYDLRVICEACEDAQTAEGKEVEE